MLNKPVPMRAAPSQCFSLFHWEYLPEICTTSSAALKTQISLHPFLYWRARLGAEPKVTSQLPGLILPLSTQQPGWNLSPWPLAAACTVPLPCSQEQPGFQPKYPGAASRLVWPRGAQRLRGSTSLLCAHLWVMYRASCESVSSLRMGEGRKDEQQVPEDKCRRSKAQRVTTAIPSQNCRSWCAPRDTLNIQPPVLQRGHEPIEKPSN